MILEKLKGKILFFFSDPGGAKPCLAISDQLNKENIKIISDRYFSFYSIFKSKVTVVKNHYDLLAIIKDFNPDIIFTGTSYKSNLEKIVTIIAKRESIKIFSFVDHYTFIQNRFILDEKPPLFPDEIWLINDEVKNNAIKENIPNEIIFVSRNPYHNWLKEWEPIVSKEVHYRSLNLMMEKKYIVFAPDPLSNINGIEIYNFDEFSASKQIIKQVNNASKKFKKNYHFLIKPHPNQSIEGLYDIFEGNENFTILSKEVDTNHIIYFSDIVLGFFSSILLEAKIMRKTVIRFWGYDYLNDPFENENIGIISNNYLISDIIKNS